QAEDGIRDGHVTGVQTCALPISELARLDALPASAWKTAVIARSGRYRRPRLHEDMVKLTGISGQVRQIAVKNIGRNEPTLIITRSEERRVGKECGASRWPEQYKE